MAESILVSSCGCCLVINKQPGMLPHKKIQGVGLILFTHDITAILKTVLSAGSSFDIHQIKTSPVCIALQLFSNIKLNIL